MLLSRRPIGPSALDVDGNNRARRHHTGISLSQKPINRVQSYSKSGRTRFGPKPAVVICFEALRCFRAVYCSEVNAVRVWTQVANDQNPPLCDLPAS